MSVSTPLSNYGHSAWGERLNEGATGLNYGRSDGPVGFGGQFGYATDVETGLILCGFRYYDPQNGRWLTRDPISYDGGVNVYAYVENNPVNYVDPDGLVKGFRFPRINGLPGLDRFNYRLWQVENYLQEAPGKLFDWVTRRKLQAPTQCPSIPWGIKPKPGTRVRPAGIPKNWRIRPTKGKGGTEYYNPNNTNESVRIMQGDPRSPFPNSQAPYGRQRDAGGVYLRKDGTRSPLPKGGDKDGDAHIPLDGFQYRP